MTHYDDLSPYTYSNAEGAEMLNVGWLSDGFEYRKGSPPSGFLTALKRLAKNPQNVFRGIHFCEICPSFEKAQESVYSDDLFLGSGEIRVIGTNGSVYVAPVSIIHYVEAHDYLPPKDFIDAVFGT